MKHRASSPPSRCPAGRYALVVATSLLSLVLLSLLRFIDGDEGYLLLAAKLVSEGKLPYRDFFFPQGPLLPVLYAALLSPFGITWQSGRFLSAALAAGTGWLVLVAIGRRGGDPPAKAFGAFLFATTALAFAWLPIAKTYSLAAFFSMAAYVATLPARDEPRATRRAIGLGLSAAMAVGVRLYCLAVVPILFVAFWRSVRRDKRRELIVALGAFVAGLLPSLWICASDPENALYGLLGYHLNRSALGFGASLSQKVLVVRELLGFGSSGHAAGLQLTALLVVLGIAAWRGARQVRRDGALAVAAGLAIVSLLPTPTFSQYFALCVPLLIPAVALSLSDAWSKRSMLARRSVLVGALAGYAALGAVEWIRYGVTGNSVIGVDRPEAWTLSASAEVARLLDTQAECGPVLSSWPGYLLESKAAPFEGSENHFSTLACRKGARYCRPA